MLERTLDPRIEIVREPGATQTVVTGSAALLQNVFLNIVFNARDSMPDGGRIVLSTANRTLDETQARAADVDLQAGPYLEVTIRDTGVGMGDDVLPHVFEPFFTTKRPGEGTGIGLAAAHGTVRSHGGAILAESTPGRGSLFRVLLPLAPDPAEPDPPGTAAAVVRGHGETILVVDDDASVLAVTAKLIRSFGYRPLACRDGTEAVETFRAHRPEVALAIVDLIMPGIPGPEVIRRLRGLDPAVRVVAVSGHADPATWTELDALAVDGRLGKPYSTGRLSRAIAQALAAEPASAAPTVRAPGAARSPAG